MISWRSIIRAHSWWTAAALVAAAVVGVVIGHPGWMLMYAVVNVFGVLAYSVETGSPWSSRTLQFAAVAQLPSGLVGLVGVFSSSSAIESDPWGHSAMARIPRERDDATMHGEAEWPPNR